MNHTGIIQFMSKFMMMACRQQLTATVEELKIKMKLFQFPASAVIKK